MSGPRKDIDVQESRIERLFGDLKTFDLILARVLKPWGSQGTVVPRDQPSYLLDDEDTHASFCKLVRSLEGGKELCWKCDLKHAEKAAQVGKAIDYICDNGLLDIAVPIMPRGQSLATIFFGQRRVSDDPDFEAEAMKKLRHAEKKLGLKPGELQESWENVDELTRAEVEQAKSDVERIAKFIAEIVSQREALEIKSKRSARLEVELDKLSLTNLSRTQPRESFWQALRDLFPRICSILDAQAGILLREHRDREGAFNINVHYPVIEREQQELYPISKSKWQDFIQCSVACVANVEEFEAQYELRSPFNESALACPQETEIVVIPIQVNHLQDARIVLILANTPPPHSLDLVAWLSFHNQRDLFEILASRIKLSFNAVLRYYERLEYEEKRRQYVQDVTHQLVGPLSGLRAHCENLLRGRLSVQRGKTVLETLVEQAGLLQRYAENFGLAARSGKSIFDPSEFRPELYKAGELIGVLIKCAKSFQGKAKAKDLKGPSVDESSFREFPPLMLDKNLFETLMLNLYDNAVKYSYESTPITIAGRVLDSEVKIEVTSHGIPLKSEEVKRIFEKYTRTPQAEEFVPVGTGIGLFICNQIAKLHNWTIRALPSKRSLYGNEVKFIITIPIAKD
jgi:signal transduction histidine kinase/ligand-binding sensor protein